ncbi:MAG: glycosyltransferase family 39 protein [Bryobacterales bacterium]
MASDSAKAVRTCVAGGVATLALASVAMLAIAIAGPATIQSAFDRLSADSSANVNAVAIQHTAAALAALFGLLAGGLWRNHASVAGWLSGLVGDVVREGVAQWQASRGALTATSVVHRGTLGFIILAGVVIRLIHLGAPMRYDEAYTFNSYVYAEPAPYSGRLLANNHVLHSIASASLNDAVVGDAPWAIRLPAFLAGVLLIPAIYLLLARFASAEAALVATGLTAASPPLVAYSVNARGYTLVALLFLGLAAVTLELQRRDDRALWAYFVLFATAGLFCPRWRLPSRAMRHSAAVLSPNRKRDVGGLPAPHGDRIGLYCGLDCRALLAGHSRFRARSDARQSLCRSGALGGVSFAMARESGVPLGGLAQRLARLDASCRVDGGCRRADVFALAPIVVAARLPRLPGLLGCVALVLAKRVVPVQQVWLFLVPLYLDSA